MAYTFYIKPIEAKSTFETTSDATPYFAGYAGLSFINSVVTIIFVPDIVSHASQRNKADAAEDARDQAAESNSVSGSGDAGEQS